MATRRNAFCGWQVGRVREAVSTYAAVGRGREGRVDRRSLKIPCRQVAEERE